MNYKRIYDEIISHRKINPNMNGYTEKHHIIPRSLGGTNSKDNIVKLTAKEHYVVHLLLTKMYEKGTKEWHKMIRAYMMMSECASPSHDNQRYTGRIHEVYRIRFSETMSYLQSGTKNSHYGMKWIYSVNEQRNTRIPKDDMVPDGWFEGRVLDFGGIRVQADVFKKKYKRIYKPRSTKIRIPITLEYVQSLYKDYQSSGMKVSKYAEYIEKPHSTISSWFLTHIAEYKENSIKPIMCRDKRMQEATLLYEQYKTGDYVSLRDFKKRANISISIMTMSKWFREFMPT